MPMMPFMGVRISWLMLATERRLDARRFEGLVARWAKAASNRRRSVMSRKMTVIVTREPTVTCDADTSAGNSLPSFLRHQISPCGPVCGARTAAINPSNSSAWRSRRRSGKRICKGCPNTSSARYWKMRSAPWLKKGDAVLLVDRYDGVLRDRQDAGEPLLSHARRKPVGPAAHSGLAYGQLRPQLANLVDQLFMAAFRHVYPAPACLSYWK